jgi:hypothetical protein
MPASDELEAVFSGIFPEHRPIRSLGSTIEAA